MIQTKESFDQYLAECRREAKASKLSKLPDSITCPNHDDAAHSATLRTRDLSHLVGEHLYRGAGFEYYCDDCKESFTTTQSDTLSLSALKYVKPTLAPTTGTLTLYGKLSAAAMKIVYPRRQKPQDPADWFFVAPSQFEHAPGASFSLSMIKKENKPIILTEVHLPSISKPMKATPKGWSTCCHFDFPEGMPAELNALETHDHFGYNTTGVMIYLV